MSRATPQRAVRSATPVDVPVDRPAIEALLQEYRNAWMAGDAQRVMATLTPESVPADAFSVSADLTGVNLFLEIRKPSNG